MRPQSKEEMSLICTIRYIAAENYDEPEMDIFIVPLLEMSMPLVERKDFVRVGY